MIVSPGKWVSEEQLIALKGIKKGTLKKAREKSFMEGREYKHVAHDGMPWDNSPCFTTWKKLIAGLSARHQRDQDVILLD
ncbi:phage excisionase [Escherichia coli]|nr:phage excisionase [Escherichia coli]